MFLKVKGVNYVNHLGKYSKYPLQVIEVFFEWTTCIQFRFIQIHFITIIFHQENKLCKPCRIVLVYLQLFEPEVWHPDKNLCCQHNTQTVHSDSHLSPPSSPSANQIRDTKSSEDTLQSENLETFFAFSCLETSFFLG